MSTIDYISNQKKWIFALAGIIAAAFSKPNMRFVIRKWVVILSLAFLVMPNLKAVQHWFAAPDVMSGGNGSITNPWPLQTALNSPSIQPGDTINLRGGYYKGPGFFSTLSGNSSNYITVRSYPGEWAIITDGGYCTLATNIPALTQLPVDTNGTMMSADILLGQAFDWSAYMWAKYANGVDIGYLTFSNSQNVFPGMVLKMDEELFTIYNKDGQGKLGIERGFPIGGGHSGTPAHTNGTRAYLTGGALMQCGNYVILRDFECVPTLFTNRIINDRHGSTLMGGVGMNGHNNKCVGLYIHGVFNGIGTSGASNEINGCVLWDDGAYDSTWSDINKINWMIGAWIRGVGVYGQGDGTIIKDCICFKQSDSGMKIYSSGNGATINNTKIVGCYSFQDPSGIGPQISSAGGVGANVNNAAIEACYMFAENPMINYNTPSNSNWRVVGNTIVASSFVVQDVISGIITNNTILGEKSDPVTGGPDLVSFQCIQEGSNALDLAHFTWDFNKYYMRSWHATGGDAFETYFAGTGYWGGTFPAWSKLFGFDIHSTWVGGYPTWNDGHADAWPSNYLDVAVRHLDYNTNRFHICVVSTSGQTNLAFNLSNYGFQVGDIYKLRDAQNPLITVLQTNYLGGNINLPLNLTNVVALVGSRITNNVHANVQYPGLFNVFILDLVPQVVPKPAFNLKGAPL